MKWCGVVQLGMSDGIARRIKHASLDEVCEPTQGDCESVAVALARTFDADAFVCVYEPGETRYATHATVEIDGQLYDGTGATSRDALVDFLTGFRPADFAGVDSHAEMLDTFREEQVATLPVDESILSFDEEVVGRVEERLRA